MHDGQPVPDDGLGLQAIAQLLRVQERKARPMGLDAPTRRAVDVITYDALMEAIAGVEADIVRKEAQLASHKLRDAALEAGDLG